MPGRESRENENPESPDPGTKSAESAENPESPDPAPCGDRLREGIAPHAEWLLELALSSPQLAIRSFTATPSDEDEWQLRLVVENAGWLPTGGSQMAVDLKVVEGVKAELVLPADAQLVAGPLAQDAGQLAGRSEQRSLATWWGYESGTPDRAVVEWTVTAPAGTVLLVKVAHLRAGAVEGQVVLGR